MESDFSNLQVYNDTLPHVETLDFQPLEQKYLSVLIVGRILYLLITSGILATLYITAPFDYPQEALYGLIGLFVIHIIWSFISTVKGFRYKSYALRQKDIVYKSGWLWKQMTTAPFNRVQHVRIDQGPVERYFNLSKLKVFTAGGSSSDMTIPGLTPEDSNRLKEYIVTQSHADEEE